MDVIHVLWRLVDSLDRHSADFALAAKALSIILSWCFNPRMDESAESLNMRSTGMSRLAKCRGLSSDSSSSSSSSSTSDVSCDPQGVTWQTLFRQWCCNKRISKDVGVGQKAMQAFTAIVDREDRDTCEEFRSEKGCPPRGVMHFFLRALGLEVEVVSGLWNTSDHGQLFVDELALFSCWFSVAMASNAGRGSWRLWRGFKKRFKLQRDDKTTVPGAVSSMIHHSALSHSMFQTGVTDCWGGGVPVDRECPSCQFPSHHVTVRRGH